ncbi:hypothetical protein MTP03_23830 [Tsukamurella sp. PLM1]|nr:hypothetical protein MTP03_23830 [Tsukamurella sp. PLM1]
MVGQDDQVAQLAVAAADVVAQERLAGETELAEHREDALLVGRELDHHLGQTRRDPGAQRLLDQASADTATAPGGPDDEPELADVVGPPG